MGGAVPPLPHFAFMAWCSVRESTGTTFTFTFDVVVSHVKHMLIKSPITT